MKTVSRAIAVLLVALANGPSQAGPQEEVRALYEQFYTAQNAGDLDKVRTLFLDSPRFLWVSDGKSFWGPDAVLERMAQFRKAEIWQVTPDLETAVAVELDEDTAFLHLPLVLAIGAREPGPDHLRFLVSMLGVRTPDGWRIAALFTSDDKRP